MGYETVLHVAIIAANNGDENTTNTVKYYKTRNNVKFCYNETDKLYFWIPNSFGAEVVRGGLVGDDLQPLQSHLEEMEAREYPKKMSETLEQTDGSCGF